MTTLEEIISDTEIESVWGNSDFGATSKRDVIRYSLLKYACGYSTGFTARQILVELNLISPKGVLYKKGKQYLFLAFYNNNSL